MAIVKYLSKGKFKGYQARVKVGGRLIATKTFNKREMAKAVEWERQVKRLHKTGSKVVADTVRDAFTDYLDSEEYRLSTNNGKRFTKTAFKNFEFGATKFLGISLTELTDPLINKHLSGLRHVLDERQSQRCGRMRSHIQPELEVLRTVFNHYRDFVDSEFRPPMTKAHFKRFGKSRTIKGADRPNSKRLKVSFTREELKEFRQRLQSFKGDECYHWIFEFQILFGRRIGEVAGLRWQDVDLVDGSIKFRGTKIWKDPEGKSIDYYQPWTKTGLEYEFNLVALNLSKQMTLLKRIKLMNRSTEFVFASAVGRVPTYSSIARAYRSCASFEDGILTHKIRKTAATLVTHLLSGDASRILLGHSTDQMNAGYRDDAALAKQSQAPARLCEYLSEG